MQPNRILPDLQASLLCEDVRQEVTGNFILIGIIGVIRVMQLPIVIPRLCLFNRWTVGVGTFTEMLRFVAPDGTTTLRQSQMKFVLQDPAHHAITVTVLGQIQLASAGVYHLEVLVDDVMKLRFPIPVILQPPPQPPAGAPPPPKPPET
jgi:hypothetical protein